MAEGVMLDLEGGDLLTSSPVKKKVAEYLEAKAVKARKRQRSPDSTSRKHPKKSAAPVNDPTVMTPVNSSGAAPVSNRIIIKIARQGSMYAIQPAATSVKPVVLKSQRVTKKPAKLM